MSRHHLFTMLHAFHRVVAVLSVALVLLLGAAGVSSELHAQLHGGACESAEGVHSHDHGHGHDHHHGHAGEADHADHQDEGCVVDFFAQGLAITVEQPRVAQAGLVGESLYQTVAEQAAPAKPAGWLPPGCGPPLE